MGGLLLPNTGCAVHYYDPHSGVEHVWGVGHVSVKVTDPNEGVRGIVAGTDIVGVSVGNLQDQTYLSVGYHSVKTLKIADDTSVRLEWPTGGWHNVRVGTAFPPQFIDAAARAESALHANDAQGINNEGE